MSAIVGAAASRAGGSRGGCAVVFLCLAAALTLAGCSLPTQPATTACWRYSLSQQMWVYFEVCPTTSRTIP